MATTDYAGIDYGHGKTNIDTKTGVRYGIIAINSLPGWIWDELEAVYHPVCPHCGYDLGHDHEDGGNCSACHQTIDDGAQYGEDADYHWYDQDGLQLQTDRDCTYLWVFKSPHTTHAQFCSPCMPGAGNLDCLCPPRKGYFSSSTPNQKATREFCNDDGGPLTYTLPPDWLVLDY